MPLKITGVTSLKQVDVLSYVLCVATNFTTN